MRFFEKSLPAAKLVTGIFDNDIENIGEVFGDLVKRFNGLEY